MTYRRSISVAFAALFVLLWNPLYAFESGDAVREVSEACTAKTSTGRADFACMGAAWDAELAEAFAGPTGAMFAEMGLGKHSTAVSDLYAANITYTYNWAFERCVKQTMPLDMGWTLDDRYYGCLKESFDRLVRYFARQFVEQRFVTLQDAERAVIEAEARKPFNAGPPGFPMCKTVLNRRDLYLDRIQAHEARFRPPAPTKSFPWKDGTSSNTDGCFVAETEVGRLNIGQGTVDYVPIASLKAGDYILSNTIGKAALPELKPFVSMCWDKVVKVRPTEVQDAEDHVKVSYVSPGGRVESLECRPIHKFAAGSYKGATPDWKTAQDLAGSNELLFADSVGFSCVLQSAEVIQTKDYWFWEHWGGEEDQVYNLDMESTDAYYVRSPDDGSGTLILVHNGLKTP